MSPRSLWRLAALGCAVAAAVALASPVALGATRPRVVIGSLSFRTTRVVFDVGYPAGTATVTLTASSGRSASVPVSAAQEATTHVTLDMARATSVVAIARAADGHEIGRSEPLAFQASKYAPTAIRLDYASGKIVGRSVRLAGYIDRRTTGMVVTLDARRVWRGAAPLTANRFTLPAFDIPEDEHVVCVGFANAWGRSTSNRVRLFNLAQQSLLARSRYILVDKSNMALYVIGGGQVTAVYPVAIGTHATPTREGTFLLGQAQRAYGAYGVLRMPLLKRVGGRWVATGYYIHGNNDPASIGTMASHGCVRMYNWAIRQVARIGWGMWVQIRA